MGDELTDRNTKIPSSLIDESTRRMSRHSSVMFAIEPEPYRRDALLPFPKVDAAIERSQFDVRPATVDGPRDRLVHLDPEPPVVAARVLDFRRCGRPKLNIEVREDVALVAAQFQ